VARKKGDTWFIGAMTNWDARDLTLDLSFLEEGEYEAVIFQDGVNADRQATDYKKIMKQVTQEDKLTVELAPGGGWAARLEKVKK
jgi:alpha-glucosidase